MTMGNNILENVWPEWTITKELGRGAYGVVYEAVRKEHQFESYAAIKVITIPSNKSDIDSLRLEGYSENDTRTYLQEVVNDFVSEIQLMESFKGIQNIVSVEDYKVVERKDAVEWTIYIRMELLTPFNVYMSNKQLSEADIIKLGCDICTALEICEKQKVIHRDIKPENIFVNNYGDFKLGDFGIARKLENLTGGLSQKGTYNYMAPEIEHGKDYNATVDLYSLGLVLYRLTNKNRLPFQDTEKQILNPNERIKAVRRRLDGEVLPPPCQASPELASIILCACSPNPEERFQSPFAMKNALTYIISSGDLNKTVSVRKARNSNFNATMSVRKAPDEKKESIQEIPTFGYDRKSNVLKIITGILAAAVLLSGLLLFIIPQLRKTPDTVREIETEDMTENTIESTTESTTDIEKINNIIENAEEYAAKGAYESAISVIETGLLTYPESEELTAKKEEYQIAQETKFEILNKALSLKNADDYPSAINILKDAIENNSSDEDLKNTYTSYCTEYKTSSIISADSLAADGQYSTAISDLEKVTEILGQDADINAKIQEYTKEKNEYESQLAEREMKSVENEAASQFPSQTIQQPFYGIWYSATKSESEAQESANAMIKKGFNAQVFVTTDWSNLNNEKWYAVSAGVYSSKKDANAALADVQKIYADAYVKYSGDYQSSGDFSQSYAQPTNSTHPEFYGIWCAASKSESEAQKYANDLIKNGFDAQIFVTTDWSNLNSAKWYVVSAGVYSSKSDANTALSSVQEVYPDAYIKYSGSWRGNE